MPHATGLEGLGSDDVIASMRETEGLSLIVPEAVARRAGWTPHFLAAWITLSVQSALDAVGLTAAVAAALAQDGIACNVVAGVFHDHLFVPLDRADAALAALRALQQRALHPHAL